MAQHIPKECIGNIYKPLKISLKKGKEIKNIPFSYFEIIHSIKLKSHIHRHPK